MKVIINTEQITPTEIDVVNNLNWTIRNRLAEYGLKLVHERRREGLVLDSLEPNG